MSEDRLAALLDGGARPSTSGKGAPPPLFPGGVLGLDVGGDQRTLVTGVTDQIHRLPVTTETLYDLASLTKLVTATVVLVLAERGSLALDDRVVDHLPAFNPPDGGDRVTIRHLLIHTAGLPADTFSWRPPLDGFGAFRYSCVGYLLLGALVGQVAGPLDAVVQQEVAGPLGLSDLGYRPLDRGVALDRIAATEVRPGMPDPRGVVHDENAASFGGVAGNAGLFGAAADLLGFGRALLDLLAGRPSALPLSQAGARAMVTDQAPGTGAGFGVGLGWRIDDAGFLGPLAGRGRTYGHTGFTGTSLLLDEDRDLIAVLLTNRVHPTRTGSQLNPFRRELAAELARTYPVRSS